MSTHPQKEVVAVRCPVQNFYFENFEPSPKSMTTFLNLNGQSVWIFSADGP